MWRYAERAAWAFGIALLLTAAGIWLHGDVMQTRALREFDASKATARAQPEHTEAATAAGATIAARQSDGTLGVLRIPGIGLEVPVLEGTDEATLNRGVGRIPSTARPGAGGNLGIAGHRDRHFRGLKDVEVGDSLELETITGVERYEVRWTRVVSPDTVEVLESTPEPSVTLVTCYPFNYVGSAPMRFIVRATRAVVEPGRAGADAGPPQVHLASQGHTRRMSR